MHPIFGARVLMPAALFPAGGVKGTERSFTVRASASTTELALDDVLWPWESKRLREALPAKAKEIRLRINSPGGDMFVGIAIYNMLRTHSARIVVEVDGLAASAASIAAMAGDEIRVNAGAFLMIHNPHVTVFGAEATNLRALAVEMDKFGDGMADIYAARTGKTKAAVLKMMAATTWMGGDEAVKDGFADKAVGTGASASAAARFDLSAFRNVPAALASQTEGAQITALLRSIERARAELRVR
jgi:ATP-dependent Clp protease, protease subunit